MTSWKATVSGITSSRETFRGQHGLSSVLSTHEMLVNDATTAYAFGIPFVSTWTMIYVKCVCIITPQKAFYTISRFRWFGYSRTTRGSSLVVHIHSDFYLDLTA